MNLTTKHVLYLLYQKNSWSKLICQKGLNFLFFYYTIECALSRIHAPGPPAPRPPAITAPMHLSSPQSDRARNVYIYRERETEKDRERERERERGRERERERKKKSGTLAASEAGTKEEQLELRARLPERLCRSPQARARPPTPPTTHYTALFEWPASG